jgi:uncharacterized membrane protein
MNKKPVSCISIVCAMFVSIIPVLLGMVAIQLNRVQDYSWNSWKYIVLSLGVLLILLCFLRYVNNRNKD